MRSVVVTLPANSRSARQLTASASLSCEPSVSWTATSALIRSSRGAARGSRMTPERYSRSALSEAVTLVATSGLGVGSNCSAPSSEGTVSRRRCGTYKRILSRMRPCQLAQVSIESSPPPTRGTDGTRAKAGTVALW